MCCWRSGRLGPGESGDGSRQGGASCPRLPLRELPRGPCGLGAARGAGPRGPEERVSAEALPTAGARSRCPGASPPPPTRQEGRLVWAGNRLSSRGRAPGGAGLRGGLASAPGTAWATVRSVWVQGTRSAVPLLLLLSARRPGRQHRCRTRPLCPPCPRAARPA